MILSCEAGSEDLKVFMEEAEEHLQLLAKDIIRLESEGTNQQLLQEIFRSAHTLKGSSSMLGHQRMAEVTHAMESLLDRLRNNKICVNSGVIDALLFGLDALKALKTEVISQTESYVDVRAIVSRLNGVAEALAEGGGVRSAGPNNAGRKRGRLIVINRITEGKLAEARREGLNIYVVKALLDVKSEWPSVRSLQIYNDLNLIGRIISSVPSLKDIEQEKDDHEFMAIICCKRGREEIEETLKLIPDTIGVEVVPYQSDQGRILLKCRGNIAVRDTPVKIIQPLGNKPEMVITEAISRREIPQSMRVDVMAVDNLMTVVDELVMDLPRISQISKMLEIKYPKDKLVGQLVDASNRMIRVIDESYNDIMKVRMVPISLVFSKLPRLVRDLAKNLHKNLDFVIIGENTELDRNMADKMRDPLVHLLRNAVDHGIESWEERQSKGKPEKALVRLSAYEEGCHVVIKLEDDGRGIDPRKVKESAARKGLLSAKEVAAMSDAEAIDLIFLPGISTIEKTSDVSGRGVGLDIVRTDVERMNGNVTLKTRVDGGTTFTIKLPLNVTAFRGRRSRIT